MDPITTAIVAALTAGATSEATDLAKNVLADAYSGLKSLITRKFGGGSKVAKAVDDLQENPKSEGKKLVLDEEMKEAKVSADPEVASAAMKVLELLKAMPHGDRTTVTVSGTGNAVAVGGSTATVNIGESLRQLQQLTGKSVSDFDPEKLRGPNG